MFAHRGENHSLRRGVRARLSYLRLQKKSMDRKVPISDATISRNVSRQLASSGLRSPCHIQVQTRQGEVTLTGSVQFVHQRNTAVQAIRTVEGITRVVEKLKVLPAAKHQHPQPTTTPQETVPDQSKAVFRKEDADSSSPSALSLENPLPGVIEPAASSVDDGMELSFQVDSAPKARTRDRPAGATPMSFTRSGDSYTFVCSSGEEAERLRMLLSSFVDWQKKNSWVGMSKQNGDEHRVTFHAKSLIEYLRQQGF